MMRTLATLALVSGASAKCASFRSLLASRFVLIIILIRDAHSHLLGPMQDRLDACGAAHCPAAVAAFAADGTPEAGFSLNTFISGP